MISAETKSWGTFSPRPCWVNRDMNSWQIKLGSFCENWNAASLALSIKGAEGGSEGRGTESAGSDSAAGGSGQGGRSGCALFLKAGTSEQGGVLGACDWVAGGGVGSLSLAEADESGSGDELPSGSGMARENGPINLRLPPGSALAGVVAKASAKATMAPAKRSQRPVCRRLHPFTESPSLESSTIRRAGWWSGPSTISTRRFRVGCPVQAEAKSKTRQVFSDISDNPIVRTTIPTKTKERR